MSFLAKPKAIVGSSRERPVYHIPVDIDVIFVADLFSEDLTGGAELTTEALLRSAPGFSVFKLHSGHLTRSLVENNKDKLWVLCNWSSAPQDALAALVTESCRFVCVEYDYKYCRFRSSHLHKLQTGIECDCNLRKNFAVALYQRASHVFFMSQGQLTEYETRFPRMKEWTNTSVLSSVWSDQDLDILVDLAKRHQQKNGKWAVLTGGSWIKNQAGIESYCKERGMPYDLIGGLPYREFLECLAQYHGLVVHPAGFDTCPRLVVEAKLLGLQLDLSDNVQHKNELWFKDATLDDTLRYLRSGPERFWSVLASKIKG